MFVGREAELQQLTEVFAKPGKQAWFCGSIWF